MNRITSIIKGIFVSIRNWILFLYSIRKEKFGANSPELILKVIMNLVALETPYYKNVIYCGRSVEKSNKLLQALITSYLETKSEVTLNQILEVLKEEFIRRENHGRQQF